MATKMNKKISRLFQFAEAQHGYFTAKQASECGFLPTNFTYHVKAGTWLHEGIGIYRLKNFPSSRESQMAFFALWSRNRDDEVQGVYSHETALSIYELSDVNPSKLHMTVPKKFRKTSKTPKVLRLYYDNLTKADIGGHHGIRVTKPLRTILDTYRDGTSHEFVEQATLQAYQRGLITKEEIRSLESKEIADQLLNWIDWALKNQRKRVGA
jgi:predicted transcriptional regulator of viral defense system